MRRLINYIRECFCKHEWERDEEYCEHEKNHGGYMKGTKVSATCNKCGYHKSYWKY